MSVNGYNAMLSPDSTTPREGLIKRKSQKEYSITYNNDDIDEIEETSTMKQMGYKQELHRGFSGLMSFSFCFTAVAIISSVSGLFSNALSTGGPLVIFWSWIVGSLMSIVIAASMGEICSTFPSAGSVYYWSGCLANEKDAPLFAYITGWFNFLGNAAGDAFYGFTFASSINALLVNTCTQPSVAESQSPCSLSTAVQMGIGMAVYIIWSLQNLLRVDYQGQINNFATFWQITSTFAIIGTLLATCGGSNTVVDAQGNPISQTPIASANQIFFQFYNGTGLENNWGTTVYIVFIGMLFTLYSLTGYEAAGHMAEETKGASKSAPLGMIWTVIISSIIGLAYIVALLLTTASDVEGYITNNLSPTSVFFNCSGQKGGVILSIFLIVNMYFSGQGSFTVTTRIAFALARDGAFPMSNLIKTILPSSKAPIGAIFFTCFIDFLMISLMVVNTTAFDAITSLSVIGYQISYAIPIYLRITHSRKTFSSSHFSLGKWSIVAGWVSFVWLFFTSFLFLLPVTFPITFENMNYTSVIVFIVSLIGGLFWMFSAKKWFKGPNRPKSNDEIEINTSCRSQTSPIA